MTFSYTDTGFLVILEPGEEVLRCLIQFAREHEIEAAVVSATGAMAEVELGAGDGRDPEHRRIRLAEPLEVCSVAGSVTLVDGEPLPHLHGSFAQPDNTVLGGQIFQAVCSRPVEIAIRASAATRAAECHLSSSQPGTRIET